MLKINIIYKFSLIIILFLGLCFLGYSAVRFAFGDFSLLFWHKFIASVIFVVATLHIYSKRKKLIKLSNEFFDVIFKRKNPSFCNMQRLVDAIESYTIREIAENLGIDCEVLVDKFCKGEVKFKDENQTLRQIAKLNDEKIFYAIVLILELKFAKEQRNFTACHLH